MSFDVRFRLKLNGKIIETNQNSYPLVQLYGYQFFDHFLEQDKEAVYHFIQQVTRTSDVVEGIFYQKNGQDIERMIYKGTLVEEDIFLVGQWEHSNTNPQEKHSLKEGNDMRYLAEKIFSALNISILLLDKNYNVIYANEDVYNLDVSQGITEDKDKYPMLAMIKEMAQEIWETHQSIQRFHYDNDKLFHVYGIHNERYPFITFIIDDRACSEEFNSLLQHKQQMESVSHLAAGFAHELRNPLSVIRGFIQLSFLTKDVSKYYETIISELDRMNNIIDDFLSLSRKSPKKHVYHPHKIFESLIPLIRSECLLRNIKLDYHFEQNEKLLLLNESMIKQIILNLLRNSVEAFGEDYPKQKNFEIYGIAEENTYTVRVSDNGPGMEKSVLRQLGKPFFTTKENGTGIGLPLCRKLIEDLNGVFNIESELGNGTTISFSIPYI